MFILKKDKGQKLLDLKGFELETSHSQGDNYTTWPTSHL